MRVLVADDDPVSRLALQAMLRKRGYEPVLCSDGTEAWSVLAGEDPPSMAILDWLMPGVDGTEICRRVRSDERLKSTYLILLTSRGKQDSIVEGLSAGANDYVVKPFDHAELEARINVGCHVLTLHFKLAQRVHELEEALVRVTQLQQLLPICSYCRKVRDDKNYWHQVEHYIEDHCATQFSHGICPECWKSEIEPTLAEPEETQR